tara:strand:- start:1768 stop:1905 length:138 start_codon:yes stop_codon:yes gene_type:complete
MSLKGTVKADRLSKKNKNEWGYPCPKKYSFVGYQNGAARYRKITQ